MTTELLNRWAGCVKGSTPDKKFLLYMNFVTVSPERGSCSELLPKKVWVSAGEDETLLENILEIVRF